MVDGIEKYCKIILSLVKKSNGITISELCHKSKLPRDIVNRVLDSLNYSNGNCIQNVGLFLFFRGDK